MMLADDVILVNADALSAFCLICLERAGVPGEDAAVIAESLVEADLRGVHTHGSTFLPRYVRGFLRPDGINPAPKISIVRERGAIAVLDGDNGLGHIVAYQAMRAAIDRAKQFGIGAVTARNSSHFGAAARYAEQALDAAMIGFATTNAPAVMAPWGGRDAVLGNNPLSWAIPAGKYPPIVLDVACSASAKARIRLAAMRGEKIPIGWALTCDGEPTDDASLAMQGVMLPFAAHKGYGLAVVNEALGGALSGALTTLEVSRSLSMGGESFDSWRIGHFFLALDINAFMPIEEFRNRMDRIIESIKSSKLAAGFARVYLPGEIEYYAREERLRSGIPMAERIVRQLANFAQELGVPPLGTSDGS